MATKPAMLTQQDLDKIGNFTYRSSVNPGCTVMALIPAEIINKYKGTSTEENKTLRAMSEICRLIKMRSRNNLASREIREWGPRFIETVNKLRSLGFGKYFFAPDAMAVNTTPIAPAAPAPSAPAAPAPAAPAPSAPAPSAPAPSAPPANSILNTISNFIPGMNNTKNTTSVNTTSVNTSSTNTNRNKTLRNNLSKIQSNLSNIIAKLPLTGGRRKTMKKKSSRRRIR